MRGPEFRVTETAQAKGRRMANDGPVPLEEANVGPETSLSAAGHGSPGSGLRSAPPQHVHRSTYVGNGVTQHVFPCVDVGGMPRPRAQNGRSCLSGSGRGTRPTCSL